MTNSRIMSTLGQLLYYCTNILKKMGIKFANTEFMPIFAIA